LLNSIKQRQTVAADASGSAPWERATPVEGFDLGKPRVKAEIASTKLRELLNNIPGDDLV
jgi:hypothetical protein